MKKNILQYLGYWGFVRKRHLTLKFHRLYICLILSELTEYISNDFINKIRNNKNK